MSGYHKDIQNGEEVDVRLAELQKNRPTRAHIINLVLNASLRIADLDILSVGMILDIVTLRGRQFHHRD